MADEIPKQDVLDGLREDMIKTIRKLVKFYRKGAIDEKAFCNTVACRLLRDWYPACVEWDADHSADCDMLEVGHGLP